LENGSYKDITILDLQLMKYSRPTVDLVYFFGSSTDAAFRKKHKESLLRIYHESLTAELKVFGYENLYSFDDLLKDFEDTWGFGFVMSCFHVQVRTYPGNPRE
jgi:hypothetical protein